MRYVRFSVFLLFAVIFNLVAGIPSIFLALLSGSESILYKVYRVFWKITFWLLGIKFQVEGTQNIPEPPFIITPNHQSYIDGPFFLSHFPYPVKAMIKKSIFRIPIIGQALNAAKFIKVERKNSLRASRAFSQASELLKKGYVLLIFPEGTRTKDGSLGRFKEGACRLAERTRTPLLPVIFFNSREFLPRGKWVPKSGTVRVKFLPYIEPIGNYREICDKLKMAIENALEKS